MMAAERAVAGHDLRFYGLPNGRITVECNPCVWVTVIESGHSLAELNRLAAQHTGQEAP